MSKRIIYCLLLFFLLADVGYTFYQHLQIPLDGDISGGVIPTAVTNQIFEDPFGLKVIRDNAVYPNPNRFFAHRTFSGYFLHAPFLFQKYVSPIESIYVSAAFAKILIQVLMTLLLAYLITGIRNIFDIRCIIAMALITPLFQTNGYGSYMGIIDHSITYTFFYALPCSVLLLFYLPFVKTFFYENEAPGILLKCCLAGLAVILPFSGPLIPGILLIAAVLYFASLLKNKTMPSSDEIKKSRSFFSFLFILAGLLSAYSLYLGTHNSIFTGESLSLSERYKKLPEGVYYLLTQKIGFPVLLGMLIFNFYLVRKHFPGAEGKKIISLFKWAGLFAILYILLLPMGGYKSYRPYILRYDTFLPVTILLFFLYGISSYFLIKNFNRKWYLLPVLALSAIFTFADKPEPGKNTCEKNALTILSLSDENPVLLPNDCTVMSWKKISDPHNSEQNAQLLNFWGITKSMKLYYQK